MIDTDVRLQTSEAQAVCFRAHTADAEDGLRLPAWADADWARLFSFTTARRIAAGEALMRRGERGRSLYLVVDGRLEVILPSVDGLSLGRVAEIGAGSVLGEQAFFDGAPRSAGVWAIGTADVVGLDPDQFAAFEAAHPALARDLLFALGRILAVRLRLTTARLQT